jgi:hypothetical protein
MAAVQTGALALGPDHHQQQQQQQQHNGKELFKISIIFKLLLGWDGKQAALLLLYSTFGEKKLVMNEFFQLSFVGIAEL